MVSRFGEKLVTFGDFLDLKGEGIVLVLRLEAVDRLYNFFLGKLESKSFLEATFDVLQRNWLVRNKDQAFDMLSK